MNKSQLMSILEEIPDNAEIKVNSIYDENIRDLTPSDCSGYYNKKDNVLYITPDIISI